MDRLLSMRVKNRIKKNEVLAGDHIYSWRPLFVYSHHGIYIGDGLVIHFTAPPEKLKATATRILTLDDKGPQISGQIAYLARMFPKMAEKYFSISKEAVEARLRNNGTGVIKVPVVDMDKFHRDGQSDANGKAIVLYKK
ncbi:hypothetical protein Vadar_007746 [Vaccinium darrowii]|uniref:Uncharacterized protein n=1 Tax=Vaccinium darrowii TaxID=229202 RepID=A0ACB7ZAN2_9ERIC|nr:hypothetical protein Vadar_007746 [Vaccinium darrowii]